jgi:hypothetical protein
MRNCADFVRDMWLSRAPHVSGAYANGLLESNSVIVRQGSILIQNLAQHAQWYEYGHNGFNIGKRILLTSKKVKVSKDGFRFLRFRMNEKGPTKFRSENVARGVKQSFRNALPTGSVRPQINSYGGIAAYERRKRLMKPMMAKSKQGGWLTISEKAIKANPDKWWIPAMVGKNLAKKIQEETRPLVMEMLRRAVEGERLRQKKATNKDPVWYRKSMSKYPVKSQTVKRNKV